MFVDRCLSLVSSLHQYVYLSHHRLQSDHGVLFPSLVWFHRRSDSLVDRRERTKEDHRDLHRNRHSEHCRVDLLPSFDFSSTGSRHRLVQSDARLHGNADSLSRADHFEIGDETLCMLSEISSETREKSGRGEE